MPGLKKVVVYHFILQKTHSSAVHVRQRAETLLQTNHFDPASVKDIADSVTNPWERTLDERLLALLGQDVVKLICCTESRCRRLKFIPNLTKSWE